MSFAQRVEQDFIDSENAATKTRRHLAATARLDKHLPCRGLVADLDNELRFSFGRVLAPRPRLGLWFATEGTRLR